MDIPFRPGFNDPSIFGSGTTLRTFGSMIFSKRASPHEITNAPVLPIGKHGEAGITQGRTIFINPDVVGNGFRPSAFAVKINKSINTAGFQEAIGRHVVHSGIQIYIFSRKSRHMFFHFMESREEADRVVPFGAGKTEQERHIGVKGTVIAGELE